MDPQTLHTFQVADEAISQLIDLCRRPGPLYRQCPRQAAQVNRTAKWLLNAISNLQRALENPCADQQKS